MQTLTIAARPTRVEEPAEAELALRFRAGDPRAFERVVRDHRAAVYRVARGLLGTHEEADEAAQAAFVRAYGARAGFRGESSLRTWLIRIVINVARSMRESASSRRLVGLDLAETIPSSAPDPGSRLDAARLRRRVRRAVATLPARQREVVLLKVFADLPHREVAEALALTEGAVKAHLHQAVSNLRKRLGATAAEGERS